MPSHARFVSGVIWHSAELACLRILKGVVNDFGVHYILLLRRYKLTSSGVDVEGSSSKRADGLAEVVESGLAVRLADAGDEVAKQNAVVLYTHRAYIYGDGAGIIGKYLYVGIAWSTLCSSSDTYCTAI